jgi:hypothetical protein
MMNDDGEIKKKVALAHLMVLPQHLPGDKRLMFMPYAHITNFLNVNYSACSCCCCCSRCWSETVSRNCSLHLAYYTSPRWYMRVEGHMGRYWQGKAENLREKPVPVPLCPPQLPHGLTHVRNRTSTVRGWRLTTWAMAWPKLFSLVSAAFYNLVSTNEIY